MTKGYSENFEKYVTINGVAIVVAALFTIYFPEFGAIYLNGFPLPLIGTAIAGTVLAASTIVYATVSLLTPVLTVIGVIRDYYRRENAKYGVS